MTNLAKSASPQIYARLAGAIYLVIIVMGGYTEGVVMSSLVVPGDTAATMHNILLSADRWSMSALGNLIVPLLAVVQIAIEYFLLRPVNRNIARLFVLLNIVNVAVEAVSKLFLLMIVPMLQSSTLESAFSAPQIVELAGISLRAHEICFNISMIYFAGACLVEGYLIFKSGFLPGAIGILMQLAGVAYLAISLSDMFAPAIERLIIPAAFIPVLVGEVSLCLWLLVMGVNVERWQQKRAQDTA